MKKGILTAALIIGLVFGGFTIASAVNCGMNFPLSLDNYYSGCSIPSSWANALEAKIGIDNSASTTSLDYKVNHIAVQATTTINGTQGSIFALKGDGTTITSTVSGATTTFSIPANTYYPYSSNPSSYIKRTDLSAAGTGLTYDNGTGAFTWTNPGYITGNQTITLTGPVTGSGATSIATTIVSPLTVNVSTTQVTSTNVTAQTLTVNQTTTANGVIVAGGVDSSGSNIVGSTANNGLQLGAQPDSTSTMYIGSNMIQVFTGGPYELCLNGNTASCANFDTTLLTGPTDKTYKFPNSSITFAGTNIDNNFSTGQTISGNVTSTSAVITGTAKVNGTTTLATTTISKLTLPNVTANSFLATDASGNVIATTTPSIPSTATSTFSFVIEYPNVGENDAIWIAPAAATVKACYAVNKSGGDTVTMGIGYSTSRSTATSSLTQIATSTVTATTSPASLTILNSSIAAGDPVIFWTGNASSTQFSITCSVAL